MAFIAIVVVVAAVSIALLLLFPGQKTPGGQRRDIELSDSAYGRFLPIARGRVRISADLVWGRQVRAKEDKGGKGEPDTWEYFADLIYAVSDASIFGPAKVILKVWANGTLIFDATGESDIEIKDGVTLRFMLGGLDQDPDVMQIEDENKWAQGHPGTILVALENFPLEHSSNNIPQLGVELDYESDSSITLEVFTGPDEPTFFLSQFGAYFVDYTRRKIFSMEGNSGPWLGMFELDFDTFAEIQHHDLTILSGDGGGAMDFKSIDEDTGYLIGWHSYNPTGPEVFNTRVYIYDPVNKVITTEQNYTDAEFDESPSETGPISSPVLKSSNGVHKVILSTEGGSDPDYRNVATNIPELTFHSFLVTPEPGEDEPGGQPKWQCEMVNAKIEGDTAWIVWKSADNIQYWSYKLEDNDTITATGYNLVHRTEVHASLFFKYTAAPYIDIVDDTIIIEIGMDTGSGPTTVYMIKWDPAIDNGTLVWVMPTLDDISEAPTVARGSTRLGDGFLVIYQSTFISVMRINTTSGTFTEELLDPPGPGGFDLNLLGTCYDGEAGCLISVFDPETTGFDTFRRYCWSEGVDGFVSLQNILREICTRLKLTEGTDFDVSAVTGGPWGWVIDKRQSGAAAIKKVLAYFYTLVGTQDGKIVFRDRGEASSGTIDIGHFVVTESNKIPWTITQADFEDLPSGAEVEFMDPDRDYEPGLAEHHRNNFPDVVMERPKPISLKGDVAMTAEQAGPIAYNLTYIPWKEMDTIKGKLPFWYIKLVANDIVLIDFGDGNPLRARVKKADWTSEGVVDFEAVFEEAGATVASEFAVTTGTFFRTGVLEALEDTAVQFLDINLLRDLDDLNQTGANTYAGLTGATLPKEFSAGTLFRTDDGLNYDDLFSATTGILFGVTDTQLPTPLTPWGLKTGDFVDVTFIDEGGDSQVIQSITYSALLNDANPLIILKAGGAFEIIQYMTVTDLGNGSYRFSDLLYGRRGTDTQIGGNAIGDTIILPTENTIRRFSTVPGSLGSPRDYRAVTQGALFESAEDQPFTVTGNDLKPYAPVLPILTRPVDDILGTFKRRPRIGTGVANGVWVHPIGEASEAYEIDIKDGPMGTVVRTLSVTSPSFTYLDADQITDGFTGSETSMTFEVFQMSAIVGRGYSYEFTEEIG